MAAVMTVTLIWGGCLSCSQYFRPPAKAAGSCCDPHGGCKEKPGQSKAKRDCNLQPVALASAKSSGAAIQSSLAFMVLSAESTLLRATTQWHAALPIVPPDRGSPPDLNVLHSVLRI